MRHQIILTLLATAILAGGLGLTAARGQSDPKPPPAPTPMDTDRMAPRDGAAEAPMDMEARRPRRGREGMGPGGPGGPGGGPGMAGEGFRGPGQFMDGPPEPLTAEEQSLAMSVVEDYDPALAERILALRQQNPERAMSMLRQHMPTIRRYMTMKNQDPALYELTIRDTKLTNQSERLGQQIRQTGGEGPTAESMRQTLRGVLTELFDVRQKMREKQLEALERRIAEMRRQTESRRDMRDQLIDQRLEELVKGTRDPMW